jgi:hypothetical protein
MKRFLTICGFAALTMPVHAGLVLQQNWIPRTYDNKLHQMIPARSQWSIVNDPSTAFSLFDLVLWLLAILLVVLLVRRLQPLFKRRALEHSGIVTALAVQKIGRYVVAGSKKSGRFLLRLSYYLAAIFLAGFILWVLFSQAVRCGCFQSAQVQCKEWLSYVPVHLREVLTGLCAIAMAFLGWVTFSPEWNGKFRRRLRLFGVAACFGLVAAFFSMAASDEVNGVVQIESKLIPHSVK